MRRKTSISQIKAGSPFTTQERRLKKILHKQEKENKKAIKTKEDLDNLAWHIGCCCISSCCIATTIYAWKIAMEQQKKNQ